MCSFRPICSTGFDGCFYDSILLYPYIWSDTHNVLYWSMFTSRLIIGMYLFIYLFILNKFQIKGFISHRWWVWKPLALLWSLLFQEWIRWYIPKHGFLPSLFSFVSSLKWIISTRYINYPPSIYNIRGGHLCLFHT